MTKTPKTEIPAPGLPLQHNALKTLNRIESSNQKPQLPTMKRRQNPNQMLAPKGKIPASLRSHITSDGLYKVVSMDFGTGFSSIVSTDIHTRDQRITNKAKLEIEHFWQYPGNSGARKQNLREVPTISAHIPGETDGSTALYGLQATSDACDRRYVRHQDLKESLYPRFHTAEQREASKTEVLKYPYIVDRFQSSLLKDYPEHWMTADNIHFYARIVTEHWEWKGYTKPLIWIFTVPSNLRAAEVASFTRILDASPNLYGRYKLESEVESALAALLKLYPKESYLELGDVFFVLDGGRGTMVCELPYSLAHVLLNRRLGLDCL